MPVILTSVLSLPPREDEFHAYPYQAAGVLAKAGVTFAFSSGGFQFSRDVPFQAAARWRGACRDDDAIKALTLDAARILGVDSQVGSIEAGKVANLVVVTGDPLEIRSQIRHVVIAGRDIAARQLARRVVQEVHVALRRPNHDQPSATCACLRRRRRGDGGACSSASAARCRSRAPRYAITNAGSSRRRARRSTRARW